MVTGVAEDTLARESPGGACFVISARPAILTRLQRATLITCNTDDKKKVAMCARSDS